jgi:hypothetical protein
MDLIQTVKDELNWYIGIGAGGGLFRIFDDNAHIYAVNAVTYPHQSEGVGVVLMVRVLANNIIVLEADNTDRPLVNRLEARGIQREKIVLAYLGETVPDMQQFVLSE